jgi:hypothetical protein
MNLFSAHAMLGSREKNDEKVHGENLIFLVIDAIQMTPEWLRISQ